MRLLPCAVALAAVLAGCSGSSPGPSDGALPGPGGEAAADPATGLLAYTTLHPGGDPYTRTYDGLLTPGEAAQGNSVPLGASAPAFETCCAMDWIDASDLLQPDQLVALRLTLTWTNGQSDRAGLDVAACLPWACWMFNYGEDESQQPGEHTDVLTFITSGRQEFIDNGNAYAVGVRYTNAVAPNGLAYTIQAEAFPVGDGLAFFDPYLVEVAEGATVTAELLGPYDADGVTAGLMAFGPDDRPSQWIALEGPHGSRHNLTLGPGSHVLVPFDLDGGFVRLFTDAAPGRLRAERLPEEFGMVEVAQVADAQERSGTYSYQADPGSIDPFPFFLYGPGVAAQDLFGVAPADLGAASATFSSSSGTIAQVDQRQFSVQHALGQNCFQCSTSVEFNPENYVDDDGSYDFAWSSRGASGTFVLFTARYVR